MKKFLESSEYIDWQDTLVLQKAHELAEGHDDEIGVARACFHFVRDSIKHSWDYRLNPVTIKASDVLLYGTGYCYAKSHLLAALLRANNIPAALCYQRLTISDRPPYCLHGLNAVYLAPYGWYKIDARGNKDGVDAQFAPPVECLAFNLAADGEAHIEGLYSAPLSKIVSLLNSCDTVEQVYSRLAETDIH